MRLLIKNMVCIRCKLLVKDEIERLGIHLKKVELGVADTEEDMSDLQMAELTFALNKSGLEIIDDKRSFLIEKIKKVVIDMVHYMDEPINLKFSEYLSRQLDYNYTYLSNVFSEISGITLEHFIIQHKIEKVKELLVYEGLSLTDIALKMGYSSVAHLSRQFKKTTGFTAKYYMQLKDKRFAGHEIL